MKHNHQTAHKGENSRFQRTNPKFRCATRLAGSPDLRKDNLENRVLIKLTSDNLCFLGGAYLLAQVRPHSANDAMPGDDTNWRDICSAKIKVGGELRPVPVTVSPTVAILTGAI